MTQAPAHAEILRTDEAIDLVTSEKDPITAALLKNAHYWFTKELVERGHRPVADYDYGFFMQVLQSVFREHEVLRRILSGEKVGQFFEDETDSPLRVEVDSARPHEMVLHGPLDVTTLPKLQRALLSYAHDWHKDLILDCTYVTNLDNEWAIILLVTILQQSQHAISEVRIHGIEPGRLRDIAPWLNPDAAAGQKAFWRKLVERIAAKPFNHK